MGVRKRDRLPVEPLVAVLNRRVVMMEGPANEQRRKNRHRVAGLGSAMPILTGRHARQLYRWRSEGGIPVNDADEIACRLGMHPIELWPDEWEVPDVEEAVEAAG
jgi:hypothetical protein